MTDQMTQDATPFPIPARYRRLPNRLTYYNLQADIGMKQGFWTAPAIDGVPTLTDDVRVITHNNGKETTEQVLSKLTAAIVGVSHPYASFLAPDEKSQFYAPTFNQAKAAGKRALTRRTMFVVLRQAPRVVWAIEFKNTNCDAVDQLYAQARMLAGQFTRHVAKDNQAGEKHVYCPYEFWLDIGTQAPKNNVSAPVLAARRDGGNEAMADLSARLITGDDLEFVMRARATVQQLAEHWFDWMVGAWDLPQAPQLSQPAQPAPAHTLAPAAPRDQAAADQAPAAPVTPPAPAAKADPWPAVGPTTAAAATQVIDQAPAAAPAQATTKAAAPRYRQADHDRNTVSALESAYTANIKTITTAAAWKSGGDSRWKSVADSANWQAEKRGLARISSDVNTHGKISAAIAALGDLIKQLVAYDIDTTNAPTPPVTASGPAESIPF